jgi:hypothetical protein
MSDTLTIITNNVPRDVLDGYELTVKERDEFPYVNWQGIEEGSDSASFFRYKGETYDLGEFMAPTGLPEFNPLCAWGGYRNDSFFSGIVIRYVDDCERIIVGRFYS